MSYTNNYLFSLPYNFQHSIHVAKDGIVGLTSDQYSDTGIMLKEPLDEKFVKFLIEKFANKNNVKIKEILRGRANLTFRSIDQRPMEPHVDLRRVKKNYNFVYYANDADGNTNLFDKKYTGEHVDVNDLNIFKSFKPKAGHALFFDGDIFHNWEYPKEVNFRFSVVINIVCDVDEAIMEKVPF
ncbi:MAG: hypothetical protein ACO3UU_12890 [Minisyncoccia bacterium]